MDAIVYKKDASGVLRFWSATAEDYGVEIEFGVLGGESQFQTEYVSEGKQGRNEYEQACSRLESRLNKKLDAGYVFDLDWAKANKPVNALGLKKPMLAQKIEDCPMIENVDYYWQPKLDGNRCLIHNDGGKLIAYTRNGKEFTTLDHILNDIYVPEGATLDGELYIHGVALQSIVSLVKRKQPDTAKVKYYVYDLISDEPISARLAALGAIADKNPSPSITFLKGELLPPNPARISRVSELLSEVRAKGYEGLMLRCDYVLNRGKLDKTGYEDGKRSKSLIKVKDWDSKEYEVVNISASEDGWAVLTCKVGNKTFNVSCPGDVPFKRSVLKNKEQYIGKFVTVKFAYYTKDGLPFHPIAEAFRDYE